MKQKLFPLIFGLVVCGGFLNAQTQTLDEAVLRAALKIGADLPTNASVAVIHFSSDLEKLNDYVINELHAAILRNRRLTPVKPDQGQFQKIKDELHFTEAGEIDEESARSIGQLLKVQYLVTGSIEITASGYGILFTAIDIESTERQSQYSASLNPNDGTQMMTELALLLSEKEKEVERIRREQAQEQARAEREQVRERARTEREQARAPMLPRAKLWSIGASLGTSFSDPWVIGTARGTLAPWRYTFFDIGLDAGFVTWVEGAAYWSLYPFVHFNYYHPLEKSGWYIGGGGGLMTAQYTLDDLKEDRMFFAVDFTVGFLLFDCLDISYTLRTNFTSASNKIAVGYVYRFKNSETVKSEQ